MSRVLSQGGSAAMPNYTVMSEVMRGLDMRCEVRGAGSGSFFIISANAGVFKADSITLGSLVSQCAVTSCTDKIKGAPSVPLVYKACKC